MEGEEKEVYSTASPLQKTERTKITFLKKQ